MYNAVGIDASKLKSTITIIQPAGVVIRKPFDVLHTSDELNTLVTYLKSLEGETRIESDFSILSHPLCLYSNILFFSLCLYSNNTIDTCTNKESLNKIHYFY